MPLSPEPRGEPAAARPLIGLVTDQLDWHARALRKAFAAAGAQTVAVDLTSCAIATKRSPGLQIAGLERLPDAMFVRTMSGGTFEAVTLRLGVLHALRECGVPVWNDARAIERCVDKSMTSFLLARAGIPTPPTWATESREDACEIVRREAARGPLVLKPLFGSQGRGLRLIREADALPQPSEVAGVYYFQRFLGTADGPFRDFRLLVSRGRVVAAMARHAPTWITNVKQGGKPVAAVPDGAMKDLAVRAAAVAGADFAGVDILCGEDAQPCVLEVNSMPAWSGLQKVAGVDIAATLAADLISALAEQSCRGAAI
jgi:tetrahydromethanopterin:alpha-L-glutamate ligase